MNKKCCEHMSDKKEDNEVIILTEGKHYSKTVCSYCGKFKKWNANPNISREVKKRNRIINEILKCKDINDKRKDFLNQMLHKRFLTPKQLEYYEGLKDKHYKQQEDDEEEYEEEEEDDEEKIPKWVLEAHIKKWEKN